VISKWGEEEGGVGKSKRERGGVYTIKKETPYPLPSPPIYLSLVVEGFVCINKWGEVGGGLDRGAQRQRDIKRGVSMFSTYILIFIYKYIIYILKTTERRGGIWCIYIYIHIVKGRGKPS